MSQDRKSLKKKVFMAKKKADEKGEFLATLSSPRADDEAALEEGTPGVALVDAAETPKAARSPLIVAPTDEVAGVDERKNPKRKFFMKKRNLSEAGEYLAALAKARREGTKQGTKKNKEPEEGEEGY